MPMFVCLNKLVIFLICGAIVGECCLTLFFLTSFFFLTYMVLCCTPIYRFSFIRRFCGNLLILTIRLLISILSVIFTCVIGRKVSKSCETERCNFVFNGLV